MTEGLPAISDFAVHLQLAQILSPRYILFVPFLFVRAVLFYYSLFYVHLRLCVSLLMKKRNILLIPFDLSVFNIRKYILYVS